MKLDKRIKDIDTIQTYLKYDVNSVGRKGYFFDNFSLTKDLTKCRYGTLVDIDDNDDNDHCFKARDENGNDFVGYYRGFIPENALKPAEKKYRPYKNVQELFEDVGVHIGDTILFRSKAKGTEHHALITSYETPKNGAETLSFGGFLYRYTMQELFDSFELFSCGRWLPFGVLEE